MTQRRRHWLYVCIAIAAVLSLGLLVLAARYRVTSRHYAFAGYVNAIRYLEEKDLPLPDSIIEIEEAYNNYEHRRIELPSPPWYLRPTFRPITGLAGGPYLILIETKPPGLQDWTRWVIYANADGSDVRVNNVTEWQLPSLIAKDDELRRKNAAPTTQNVAPSP